MQRLQQIEASVSHQVTRRQALEEWALGWQQRVEAKEQQLATVSPPLQEEVRAREVLTQQRAGNTAHQATQPPSKLGKRNVTTRHTPA
jgi:hypothetical protein